MYKKLIFTVFSILFIAVCFFYGFNAFYPLKYLDIIEKYAETYDLPIAFVCAVIQAESRFDMDAVSKKDARGLMQIAKITSDWAAEEIPIENYSYEDIFDPELNIMIGCWYLNRLGKQFDGAADTVLAAYNAGSGNVAKWLSSPENSNDGINLYYVPFGETRLYIEKVNRNVNIYEFILCLNNLRTAK